MNFLTLLVKVRVTVFIIPSKNQTGGIPILRNFVFNEIPRKLTKFPIYIPAEIKHSKKLRRNSVVWKSAGHTLVSVRDTI